MPDHVHMMISIPPKYAVSQVIGYVKGKSAIHLARVYGERRRNFVGQHFWARGYFVSTVGRDEAAIREYIKSQEKEDRIHPTGTAWTTGICKAIVSTKGIMDTIADVGCRRKEGCSRERWWAPALVG